MLALAILPIGATGAAQDTSGSVSIEKSGWWSLSNQETTTPNGALAPPIPRSPAVPDNSLPVTAVLGQTYNMSAISLRLPEGTQATSLMLTLPPASNGDSNGSQAKIAACAVTAYWEGGDNGKWDAKPQSDCSKAKAVGTRNGDGTWTFELTPIAALWADPFESIPVDNGFALVPDDPTGSFQVAFAPDGASIDAQLTKVSTPGDESFTADVSQETIPAGTPTYSLDAGSLPPASAGSPGAARGGGTSREGTRVAASRPRAMGNVGGNLPLGMLLLIPFVLLLAILAGQSLAAGRPRSEHVRRQGGVGRALAARTARPIPRSRPEMT